MDIAKIFHRILLTALTVVLLTGCEYDWSKRFRDLTAPDGVEIGRYDRLQSRYLTTGDFSAIQQMNTEYPMQTRTLIEDVLKIGRVNEQNINTKFLAFYQDSTLQALLADAEAEYANMDDLNRQLTDAFKRLQRHFPDMPVPQIYAQIGDFAQSIIIGDGIIGISLDKYMGENYPAYKKFYTYSQRRTMTRSYIVPDCLCFYLISMYPLEDYEHQAEDAQDVHMGKVMWVVNQAMDTPFFQTDYVTRIDTLMRQRADITWPQLLSGGEEAGR